LVGYDETEQQYYTWGRLCFNCGFENELRTEICRNCKQSLRVICPKCGAEVSSRHHSKRCGLNYSDGEVISMKKTRSAKTGLYVLAIMFLSIALLFVLLLIKNQGADQGRMVQFVIGGVIFFGLFIAVSVSLIRMKED
jgi:hypothetical protein